MMAWQIGHFEISPLSETGVSLVATTALVQLGRNADRVVVCSRVGVDTTPTRALV